MLGPLLDHVAIDGLLTRGNNASRLFVIGGVSRLLFLLNLFSILFGHPIVKALASETAQDFPEEAAFQGGAIPVGNDVDDHQAGDKEDDIAALEALPTAPFPPQLPRGRQAQLSGI